MLILETGGLGLLFKITSQFKTHFLIERFTNGLVVG
jgi:hypothetical protein